MNPFDAFHDMLKTMHLPFYILDERGESVPEPDSSKWAAWFETSHSQRLIAQTTISDKIRVSTIFTGVASCSPDLNDTSLDYLWETMIFGGPYHGFQKRYKTKAEAIHGHQVAVTRAIGDGLPLAEHERGILDQFCRAMDTPEEERETPVDENPQR